MSFKDTILGWINTSDDGFASNPDDAASKDEFDFTPADDNDSESNVTKPPVRQPAPKMSGFHKSADKSAATNVVNINNAKPVTASKPRVVFQKADKFDDVFRVADVLKDKRIVVLNLETCPDSVAQRVIDVLFGVAYADNGDFKKIANKAYVITPNNVSVTGELEDNSVDQSMFVDQPGDDF